MNRQPTPTPETRLTALDYFFRALIVFSFFLYGVAIYDNLAHNFASISTYSYLLHIVAVGLLCPSLLVVSGLIIWRVPGNNVGRFMLLLGLGALGWQFSYDAGSPELEFVLKFLFFIYWFGLAFPSLIYLMLSFPSGHIYPPSWVPWVWAFAIIKFAGTVLELATVAPGDPIAAIVFGETANLFFVPTLRPFAVVISATIGSNGLWYLLGVIAGFISLVLRYRDSNYRERQQIKWVVWSFALLTLSALVVALITVVGLMTNPSAGDATGAIFFVAILVVILSIGISILRYHLFDIDVIIRRTVTYAILGLLLAMLYFASVIVLQQLFAAVTRQRNEFITVLSTLVIAALFIPLRNRIQRTIDKRFYRKKYDAQEVLTKFAETVRDETDLETLSQELIHVVNETLQPRSVTLWLKKPDDRH